MDKVSKEKIKKLKVDKKYDEIFTKFGRTAYEKYVPAIYRRKDLKKLKKDARYEDIYNKYGESKYNTLLINAMYKEIKEEKGTIKAVLWRTVQEISLMAKKIGIYSALSFLTITPTMALSTESIIKENAIKYESEINDYNKNISNYAKQVNSMNLSHTQIFMKVIDDMWKNIQGYANPQKDITGFLELDLDSTDGYGVCRNMASDIAKKLNEINPEYNARTMIVEMGEKGFYEIANIQRIVLETNKTVVNEEEQTSEDQSKTNINNTLTNLAQEIIGNHMVTLVDIQEYNLTIVLDSTNPGIGIYQNGRITMLNSTKENGVEFKAKEYINATMSEGMEGITNTVNGYLKSYGKSSLSLEEIEEKFGLEAQNKALDEVRQLTNEKENIEDREKSFKESIKVDIDMQSSLEKTKTNQYKTIENDEIKR